jgi:integrase
MSHGNLHLHVLKPTLAAAGIPNNRYAFHSFRRWFASWCLASEKDGGRELPLFVVSRLLGHSSINLTSDVYGHLMPERDGSAEIAKAAAKFGSAVK